MIEIYENIYGHLNRTQWAMSKVSKDAIGMEFGCGTGIMITSYFNALGYSCIGIDLDEVSIDYGKQLFKENGLDPEDLVAADIGSFADNTFDYIIASEVFEHIEKKDIDSILELIKRKLKPGGILLVTVPNGYGWFEFEAFLYNKLGLGFLLEKLYIVKALGTIKKKMGFQLNNYSSTLANSPHVRRFTWKSIAKLVESHGFKIQDRRGSVLFCGNLSNLLFTGFVPIMNLTKWLGKNLGPISSGFYLHCTNSGYDKQQDV